MKFLPSFTKTFSIIITLLFIAGISWATITSNTPVPLNVGSSTNSQQVKAGGLALGDWNLAPIVITVNGLTVDTGSVFLSGQDTQLKNGLTTPVYASGGEVSVGNRNLNDSDQSLFKVTGNTFVTGNIQVEDLRMFPPDNVQAYVCATRNGELIRCSVQDADYYLSGQSEEDAAAGEIGGPGGGTGINPKGNDPNANTGNNWGRNTIVDPGVTNQTKGTR